MSFAITKYDLLLLKYLFESKFLTRDQVKNYVWNDKGNSSADNRIAKLLNEDIIQKKPDPVSFNRKKTVLLGTKKGLSYLELHRNKLKNIKRHKGQFLNYYHPQKYYSATSKLDLRQYEHDRDVNTLRFFLEDQGNIKWIPHNVISKDKLFSRKPDGAFIDNNEHTFAVELEYNQKSRYVLKKIFAKYRDELVANNLTSVLYITKTDSLKESMLKYFIPEMVENFIYIVNEEDEEGNVIKKEKPYYTYRKFFVTTFEEIMNGNFILDGADNYSLYLNEYI